MHILDQYAYYKGDIWAYADTSSVEQINHISIWKVFGYKNYCYNGFTIKAKSLLLKASELGKNKKNYI